MTFASAERAYLTPPEPHECSLCEDDPDMDHDECLNSAAGVYEDEMAERAERAAEDREDEMRTLGGR